MKNAGWVSLMVLGLAVPQARATSPEPPVRVELKVGAEGQERGALELRVAVARGKDAQEYAVAVKRVVAGADSALERGASKTVGSGRVAAGQDLVVEERVEGLEGRGPVVRARYELEVRRADGRYNDFIVVDQAFVRDEQGGLEPIDAAEEARLTAGVPPITLADDQHAAGGNAVQRPVPD